jgi:Amt family ammonium transporter
MISAGSVRQKNVHNTLLKNLIDACGSAIGFWSIGYAFAYGHNGTRPTSFIGATHFFLHGVENLSFWFFQYAFASTCVTIVAGSLAERCQLGAYFAYAIALTGFVYPIALRAMWSPHGFLSPKNSRQLWGTGAIDFAGGGVVHLTGGFTALVAVVLLGPRAGRFYDDMGNLIKNPLRLQGHSVSLQVRTFSRLDASD